MRSCRVASTPKAGRQRSIYAKHPLSPGATPLHCHCAPLHVHLLVDIPVTVFCLFLALPTPAHVVAVTPPPPIAFSVNSLFALAIFYTAMATFYTVGSFGTNSLPLVVVVVLPLFFNSYFSDVT